MFMCLCLRVSFTHFRLDAACRQHPPKKNDCRARSTVHTLLMMLHCHIKHHIKPTTSTDLTQYTLYMRIRVLSAWRTFVGRRLCFPPDDCAPSRIYSIYESICGLCRNQIARCSLNDLRLAAAYSIGSLVWCPLLLVCILASFSLECNSLPVLLCVFRFDLRNSFGWFSPVFCFVN